MKKSELIESKDVFLVEDKIKHLDYPTPKELLEKLPKRFNKKTLRAYLKIKLPFIQRATETEHAKRINVILR